MSPSVQCYFLTPTKDVPNSPLPVLHYQGVLPTPATEESVTEILTSHKWEKRGCWGHIPTRHFHPNTHECYGIFRGQSTLLLGKIEDGSGVELKVKTGDVIVLPAGTAHSCLESAPGYQYIGVYPQRHPKYVNETGKKPASELRSTIKAVEMPEADPVYGESGPLIQLWHAEALAKL